MKKDIRGWLTPRKEATRGAAEKGGWASFPYLHLHCKTPVADAPESSCRRRRGGPSFPGAKRPARPQGWGAQHSSCRGRAGKRAGGRDSLLTAPAASSRRARAHARWLGSASAATPGRGGRKLRGFSRRSPGSLTRWGPLARSAGEEEKDPAAGGKGALGNRGAAAAAFYGGVCFAWLLLSLAF